MLACSKLLLGYDGIDDRAGPGCPSPESFPSYIDAANSENPVGMRIGILKKLFKSTSSILSWLLKCVTRRTNSRLSELSWKRSQSHFTLWQDFAILSRCGGANTQSGGPNGRRGLYLNDLTDNCFPQTADAAAKTYFTVRNTRLLGEYAGKNYPAAYGKAMNLPRQLKDQYDESLQKYDLLVLPVVNYPARHADPTAPPIVPIERFLRQTLHTTPFNATGHPALSLPCGMLPPVEADILNEADRNLPLPDALQIVGKYFDEATIFRAAGAWATGGNCRVLVRQSKIISILRI